MTADPTVPPSPGWASACGHALLSRHGDEAHPQSASDRLLICERVARYGWSYDERDRAGLADCFTRDGVWEGSIMGVDSVGPFQGREAVVDFLSQFWEVQTDQRRHLFTNVVIQGMDARTASVHAYLMLTAASEGAMRPVSTGPYRFELLRDADGGWRISRLVAGFDAPF